MPRRNHITTQQAIDNFLFQRLRRNPECQEFIRTTEVPAFITDNLAKDKQLRPYQREALLNFHLAIRAQSRNGRASAIQYGYWHR